MLYYIGFLMILFSTYYIISHFYPTFIINFILGINREYCIIAKIIFLYYFVSYFDEMIFFSNEHNVKSM